jgi:hypothetical protein
MTHEGSVSRGALAERTSAGHAVVMDARRHALALGSSLALGVAVSSAASQAAAQDRRLESVAAVHDACRASDAGRHDVLYSVLLDAPARLEPTPGDEEGETVFAIREARGLRALGGSVQLVPADLEMVGFVAGEARARSLEVALARGARVRLGFFLGFDQPERRACLVRPPQSVTAVRADVAFVELVDPDGSVVAREDHDRLRAWADDPGRQAATEPQATVGAVTAGASPAPEAWSRTLRGAPLARALVACHVAGVSRGAARDAMIQARLRVDGRTGRIEDGVVEVGNVGDEEESSCLLRALRGVELAAGPSGPVDLRVPVVLRAP